MKENSNWIALPVRPGARNKIFCLLLVFIAASFDMQAQDRKPLPREFNGAAAERIVPGAQYVKEGISTSYPSFVRFDPGKGMAYEAFFPWLRQTLKVPASVSFILSKKEQSQTTGITHYRYTQTYQQVPIDKTTYIVHVKDGKVAYFSGLALDVPGNLSPVPKLSEAQALEGAKRAIGAKKYKWEVPAREQDLKKRTGDPAATYFPKGELCWQVDQDNKTFRLAYRFDIQAADPDLFKRVYIDAMTGGMLQVLPMESNCSNASVNTIFNGNRQIKTENYSGSLYRLRDDCQGAKFWIRDWNNPNSLSDNAVEIDNTTNTWTTSNERFGGTVLWLTEQAYDFWQTTFSRNSYDDGGGDVTGYINAYFSCPGSGCTTPNNASMSFTGGTMKVGAGSGGITDFYSTVDIIGHEYTHAVTGSEAQLVYQNESGALNESFSDIFGEMNEFYVFGSNDWLLGAERSSGYIRNMSNPNDKGDPDTYQGTNWCDYTNGSLGCTANDAGGVHTNSGVQNFWFYLLVNGGSGTNDNGASYSVTGIGRVKARNIAYDNLVNQLGKNATYSDARAGSIQSAIDLYGACSDEVKQVTNAWHAVGVGAAFIDASVSVSSYHGRDVSCHDACDGSASVTITSGTGPVITWSTGAHTSSISNLCPGNYSVTVTDLAGLGCSVTKNFTIHNAPLLVAAPAVTSDYHGYGVSCSGSHDGTAAANASGGTPPYTYSWSNGQTTANATGLYAGNYSLTVTDANGCTANGSIHVTEPPQLTTTAAPITNYNGYNVRCHGGSDGAAEAYPAGGVPGYTYSWNTVPPQTTKVAGNLMAGNYSVTVTDLNGCNASANTTLTEPPQLTIDAGPNKTVYYGYPDSACAKLVSSGAGGGVPPYTLTWSTGSHAASISVCPTTSTTYYLTITDKNNCSVTDSVRVCVIDVRCGNNLDKVTLCHNTGSSSNPNNTLCVALSAAQNHIAHGDQLAACGTLKTCTFAGLIARMYNGYGHGQDAFLVAFPNPFTNATTVQFRLPVSSRASLKIYDISGRMISQLFDGAATAGQLYEQTFDGAKLPAGMYFMILKTDAGDSYAGKLLLNR